ncbi:MAG TPA: SIMPL domain-containing protein [Solirubrobacteraceae bacterium]|nr:SIMPL domain-containing protein [Solirubrobacteraceae bacterium]
MTGAARAAASPTTASSTTSGTLSVLGQGRVFVRPNVAHVSAFVRSVAGTEAAASASADRRARAVLAAIEAQGVPASALTTPAISVNREVLLRHHHRLVRWAASERVEVRLTNLKLVSPVLAAVTRAGADHVSGPSYGFSSPDLGVQAAEHAALVDARTLADAAAATDGVTILGVQSIDLNPESGVFSTGSSGAPASTAAPSQRAPQPPARAGRVEVDATVAVVYLIAPGG